MKKRILFVFLCLIVYVVLRLTGVIKSQESWPLYNPKDSGFSVLVPGRMIEDTEKIADDIVFKKASIEWQGVVFAVSYGDLPDYFFEKSDARAILDSMINMVTKGGSWRVVKKEDYIMQGAPAVSAEYENSEGNKILVRYCLKEPAIYRAIVSVEKKNLESKRSYYEKFLNSFKLD